MSSISSPTIAMSRTAFAIGGPCCSSLLSPESSTCSHSPPPGKAFTRNSGRNWALRWSRFRYGSVEARNFKRWWPDVIVAKVSEGRVSAPSAECRYPEETGAIIVGAGLAGLAAARALAVEKVPFILLEASDGVGGRVRTDELEGFLLDRGFQIHITAYPEAQRALDYADLDLRSFYAGAMVWFDGKFHKVADPFRHVADGVVSLINPIGSVLDKILVGIVRLRAASREFDDILTAEETTILERLSKDGFSQQMVDRFFRPFFGGIFFDTELQTTSRLFDFVFKCLALGSNTLPAKGIGAISEQLSSRLPAQSVFLNSKVAALVEDGGAVSGVRLADGMVIRSKQGVIIAVEGPEAVRLMEGKLQASPSTTKPARSTVCLYFCSSQAPFTREPVLLLNGSGKGIVNNMFFPSSVVPSSAPPGTTLVSVSLIGTFEGVSDSDLESTVRVELSEWFGRSFVDSWTHLRTYRIPYAQPNQTPPSDLAKGPKVSDGLFVCGDHRISSTFDGALRSGRVAGEALLLQAKVKNL